MIAAAKKNTTTLTAVRLTHAGQTRKRIEQGGAVSDVDVGMRPVVRGSHDLPVLPDPENEREQKDQAGRKHGHLGVDSQREVHRPNEFSCASES